MARGTVGEILVRGAGVMLGYLDDPVATAEAIDTDGWLHTGDVGTMDDNGYLRITDRKKDLYISGGFNVYPAEVEAGNNDHQAVLQSAVVGRSVDGNEEIIAFVQLMPGAALPPDEFSQFVAPLLTAYKRPSRFVVLNAFPAGSTGKILKHKLKELAATL